MDYFKKCPNCGRYMTPHLNYLYGQVFTIYSCFCGYTEDPCGCRYDNKTTYAEVEQVKERLTEDYYDDMQKIIRHYAKSDNIDLNTGGDDFQDIIDKLAEYETAEEEGRLVVLPCDTVYFIWNKSSGISHVRAKSILDLSLHEILEIDKDGRYWSVKEEAEKALKEMKIK